MPKRDMMLSRIGMTTFLSLMALGATCEQASTFDRSTMSLNVDGLAHCLDPRRIDIKGHIIEGCEAVGKMMGFGIDNKEQSDSTKAWLASLEMRTIAAPGDIRPTSMDRSSSHQGAIRIIKVQ